MRKMKNTFRLLLFLIIAAVMAVGVQVYLLPLIRSGTVTRYEAYPVVRGDVETEKSFSATISVANSETHKNSTRATAIREIYVKNGQSVRKGDKLMLLDNGELLRAGLDGTVTEMRFDTEDWLWNDVNLIQISDLTRLNVSLSVDEYDVRNVSSGQKCLVTIVPTGEVYETELVHVDRVSASSGQVANYTARAELTVPEGVLPGMTASVSIPSEVAADVLLLDMAALAFDEEKKPYVLQKTETGYERIYVTTGLNDGMRVEIVSGLKEGDTVWAAAGVETQENPYTLVQLYKKLVGEKVVINDMTGGAGQGGRTGTPGRQTPGGMNRPAEGSRAPSQAPQGTPLPEATNTAEPAGSQEPAAAPAEASPRREREREETP